MKQILVVEDDPTLNTNIKEALSAENMHVETAFDGLIAEKILARKEFDCVVLDVNLPGKNGFDVCKHFRTFNTTTPVLILTAFDELEDKVEGFEKGADDYLTKPFFMKELIMRIGVLTKRSKNPRAKELIVAGDIQIDESSKRVTRQGKEITLTPREYEILLTLVTRKGEAIHKKELIKQIWGSSFDANTNTIEVFVNFLRKKVDVPFGKTSIKTKIGFGYYFEE